MVELQKISRRYRNAINIIGIIIILCCYVYSASTRLSFIEEYNTKSEPDFVSILLHCNNITHTYNKLTFVLEGYGKMRN